MGGQSSKDSNPSSSNPSSTSNFSEMPSSKPHESNHGKEPESRVPVEESLDPPTREPPSAEMEIKREEVVDDGTAPEGEVVVVGEEEGEDEEVGECPFCLFMKEGGCRDEFTEWENCVEEAEKNKEDVPEKCFEITSTLRKCMEVHRDYYAPLLRAEEEAMKALEEEKGKEGDKATANQSEKGEGRDGSGALNGSEKDSEGKNG